MTSRSDPEQFDLEQLARVRTHLARVEALVARHFAIPALPSGLYPYEVVTLADLEQGERAEGALAHLVVYQRPRRSGVEHLYRVCLQDDVLLRRARGGGPGWLDDLLAYVICHELVHVVRFQRGEQSITAPAHLRQTEEETVHRTTLRILTDLGEQRLTRLANLYETAVVERWGT